MKMSLFQTASATRETFDCFWSHSTRISLLAVAGAKLKLHNPECKQKGTIEINHDELSSHNNHSLERLTWEDQSKHLMASQTSYGSFDRVTLKGTNVGAAMTIRHGVPTGEPQDSCCINIYVNNNVQGVNNSILLGSEVKMRDPGVSIFLEDLNLGKKWMESNKLKKKKKKKTKKEDTALGTQLGLSSIFTALFVLLLLLFLSFS